MTRQESFVWEVLCREVHGLANGQTRAWILAKINIDEEMEMSDRELRKAVEVLVTNYKKPICSSASKGYYVAQNIEELRLGVAALRTQARSISIRANILEQALIDPKGQGRLL